MAVVIESYNTGGGTCTKPTGLSVGDMLVAGVRIAFSVSDKQINVPSGWTQIENARIFNIGENQGIALGSFYKIADASDVAASDFTFTATGATTAFDSAVLRLSGVSPTIPLNSSSSDCDDGGGSSGSYSFAGFTPSQPNCLFLLFAGTSNSSGHSSYAIATNNPTWTELFGAGTSFSMAHALRPETTATGNASYSITGASINTDAAGILVAIKPLAGVTITPDPVTSTGTIPTPTPTGGATVAVDPVVSTGTVNSSEADQADWSASGKNSASFTSESKTKNETIYE